MKLIVNHPYYRPKVNWGHPKGRYCTPSCKTGGEYLVECKCDTCNGRLYARIIPDHRPKGAKRIARYEPGKPIPHVGGTDNDRWLFDEVCGGRKRKVRTYQGRYAPYPHVAAGDAAYDTVKPKRNPQHLLGSVPKGWNLEREQELFDGDPRFGAHAPTVMRKCLAQRSVKYSDNGVADAQDLDDAVANALDWLYSGQTQGRKAVAATSGHSDRPLDYVCQQVKHHLAARDRIESPIAYEKVRQGGKRVYSNGGYEVEPIAPFSQDDEDNPDYSIDPEWDRIPEAYRPKAYRSPEIVLGLEDNILIGRDDRVIIVPYPKSHGESVAESHRQVLANAELSGNPRYADLRKVMDCISLKIEDEATTEIDIRTLREVATDLGVSYGTVLNRIKAYRELWTEILGDALCWQPTRAELRNRRRGASGTWPARGYDEPDTSMLGGLVCEHCRAAAEAGEMCRHGL